MTPSADGAASADFAAVGRNQIGLYDIYQGISAPLNAQTISGTITGGGLRGKFAGGSPEAPGTIYLRLVVRVVSNDGLTERGTLLDVRDDVALGSTTNVRQHPTPGTALTPVTAQAGDRIVVDVIGEMTAATSTTANLYFQPRTDQATDISGDTGGGNTWLEFSQALSFQTPVDPPTVEIATPSIDVTRPAGDKVYVEFTAANQFGDDLSPDASITSSNPNDGSLGALGRGSPFVLDTAGMTNGDRTVTVTATDPNSGLSASDSFLLTIGTPVQGGAAIPVGGGDLMLIAKDESVAALRTVPLLLKNSDGTPYATAIADGAVAWLGNTQAANALVAEDAPNGDYTLELTAAEVAAARAFRVKVAGKGDGTLVQVQPGAAVSATGGVPVSGYETGQDPATLLLVTPANKLATDAGGKVPASSVDDLGAPAKAAVQAELVTYGAAKPGNAMALLAAERTTLATVIDAAKSGDLAAMRAVVDAVHAVTAGPDGIDAGVDLAGLGRLLLDWISSQASGAGPNGGTLTIPSRDGLKTRLQVAVDQYGNRAAPATLDLTR